MRFGLSEEQRLLQDTLKRVLDEYAPLETVRLAVAGDAQPGRALTATLVELGVPGLLVPHNFGGLGLGMLDAALSAEALGAHVAPVAYLAPLVIAPTAVRLGASPPCGAA